MAEAPPAPLCFSPPLPLWPTEWAQQQGGKGLSGRFGGVSHVLQLHSARCKWSAPCGGLEVSCPAAPLALYYLLVKLVKWRNNLPAEEISPATFTILLSSRKEYLKTRIFFSFSSSEFFCLGSYTVQDKLFRVITEKVKRNEVWETSFQFLLVDVFHVHVYIIRTFAPGAAAHWACMINSLWL